MTGVVLYVPFLHVAGPSFRWIDRRLAEFPLAFRASAASAGAVALCGAAALGLALASWSVAALGAGAAMLIPVFAFMAAGVCGTISGLVIWPLLAVVWFRDGAAVRA